MELKIKKFNFTLEGTTPKNIPISSGLFLIDGGSGIRVIGACSANTTTVATIINGFSAGFGTFSMSKETWGSLTVSQSISESRTYTAYVYGN